MPRWIAILARVVVALVAYELTTHTLPEVAAIQRVIISTLFSTLLVLLVWSIRVKDVARLLDVAGWSIAAALVAGGLAAQEYRPDAQVSALVILWRSVISAALGAIASWITSIFNGQAQARRTAVSTESDQRKAHPSLRALGNWLPRIVLAVAAYPLYYQLFHASRDADRELATLVFGTCLALISLRMRAADLPFIAFAAVCTLVGFLFPHTVSGSHAIVIVVVGVAWLWLARAIVAIFRLSRQGPKTPKLSLRGSRGDISPGETVPPVDHVPAV